MRGTSDLILGIELVTSDLTLGILPKDSERLLICQSGSQVTSDSSDWESFTAPHIL